MARDFAGGVTTDVITVPNYAAISDLDNISVSIWSYRRGTGGATFGRNYEHVNGVSLQSGAIETDPFNWQTRRWSTTTGQHSLPAANAPFNKWANHIVTYSYSSTANLPVYYINGVAQAGVVAFATPAGTLNTGLQGNFLIGNRAAGDRAWDGLHAEVAVWNRILSGTEAATVANGSALDVPTGRVLYLPLCGKASPERNLDMPSNSGVVTGTTSGTHPKWGLPCLPQQGRMHAYAAF